MNEMFDKVRVKSTLEETVTSVLAEMTFLDCLPVVQINAEELAELSHCVAVDALKPGSFRLEIRVSKNFQKKIMAMLFDTKPQESNSQDSSEADLLLEILNVMTGNFITQYFGASAAPKLELPRYLYFNDPAEGDIVATTIFDAEGDLIQVTLRSVRYRY